MLKEENLMWKFIRNIIMESYVAWEWLGQTLICLACHFQFIHIASVREASERARNRNEWRMIVTQFWLASAVATGLPCRGSPVVGAVGETASMKRRKLWKTGEDGLCCSSSAIQTRLDPSSLLEERSETPIVFVCFFCVVGYPPNWGKRPRYIDR